MANYKISGVWKNSEDVITHYAFHEATVSGTSRAIKKTKLQAIALLEVRGNSAVTWVWNYRYCGWRDGEKVEVVNGKYGKYLRSDPNTTTTDNLAHLIDFDWISP